MLEKRYYYDENHFQIENEVIFSQGWVFACMADEVNGNNDFVTLDISGEPVVIQNFKGEIRAFQNICSHRFNKIQTEEFGKRPLTCGYHCWSFDKEGIPFFVPKKELFEEFKAGKAISNDFCLKRFELEICGKFVFIKLDNTVTLSLADHLGTYYNILSDLSNHIGTNIHRGSVTHQANWKILVENVLECYHCSVVHKDTLYGKLGVGSLALDDVFYSEAHSSCHFPKRDVKKLEGKKRKLLSFLDNRELKHNSFYHIFIFPNLFVSSTEGASFYVGQLFPANPDHTDLKIRFFEPNINYENVSPVLRDALAEESVKLGYAIIEEDKTILENIQKGVRRAKSPGIINEEEVRIKYFFDKYKRLIEHS